MAINLARMGSIPRDNTDYYGNAVKLEDETRAARDLRRKAAQDLRAGEIDLAAKALTQKELERTTNEGAIDRGIRSRFMQQREGAQGIPVGVRSPEFVDDSRPSNAPFGPMGEPVKPTSMESRTLIDLAVNNPDLADAFRTKQIAERQGNEDRSRKFASEDQKQIQTGAEFAYKKQKDETDAQFNARQQAEIERQNRAKNSIDWFQANTGRQNANTAQTVAANKPTKATSDQNTYANYGRRLAQAEQDFNTIKGSGGNRASLGATVKSRLPNFMQPGLLQQQTQAERNFLNATLRRESGAVISPSEFQNGEAQYFERYGDSPETIAQKKRNRELVLESFKNLSGPAWQNAGGSPAALDGLSAEEEEEYQRLLEAAGQ